MQLARVPDLGGNRFWFLSGVLLWSIVWVAFCRRNSFEFVRTVRHELTHYLWAELMGGKSHSMEMGRRRGVMRFVYPYSWGKEVIDLAPYFFPLYSLHTVAVKLMVQPPFEPLVCLVLGIAWSWFYLDLGYILRKHFTTSQTDIEEAGPKFAALVIISMNLLATGIVWSSLSAETSVKSFLVDGPVMLYHFILAWMLP